VAPFYQKTQRRPDSMEQNWNTAAIDAICG
jgi:hypothetical protein